MARSSNSQLCTICSPKAAFAQEASNSDGGGCALGSADRMIEPYYPKASKKSGLPQDCQI